MLEEQVGKRCDFHECNQRDFMPFECQGCGEFFCSNHKRSDDHRCIMSSTADQLYVIICPICEMRLRMRANENADQIWQQHSSSGECGREQQVKARRDMEEAGKVKVCQLDNCKKRLNYLNRHECQRCLIQTCSRHRQYEAHNCRQIITSDSRLAKSKLLQLG